MCCIYCSLLMHELCLEPSEVCCCGGKGYLDEAEKIFSGKRGPKPNKPGANMSDPLSTGRKRAAVIYSREFFETEPICAWKGLRFAGGGPVPIIGCSGKIATARHHGPDKSVLNNEPVVNLHAICEWCHNRWHAVNDKFYLPPEWKKGDPEPRPENGDPWLPVGVKWSAHDIETEADETTVKLHEAWWNLSTHQREKVGSFDDYARTYRPKHSSGATKESSGSEHNGNEAVGADAGAQPSGHS